MELTAHEIWEVLVEKFGENREFAYKFHKRKAWNKNYYDLIVDGNETHIVVDYSKRENRLEASIYFFGRRDAFDKLYKQKEIIDSTESVNLSYEVRSERTQGIYIKRYDIHSDVDRKYLEELVKWIQDTALLLCYINEKYGLGKDVTRPGGGSKIRDIHEPMLPSRIVEDGNDFLITCGRCGEEYRKANRCTFCGQTLKWPDKDELSKYLLRKEGNKRQLVDADDWATVTAFDGITRQQALEIIESFLSSGFTYHVGTADLVLDYKSRLSQNSLCGMMLCGNERGAAIQPSAFFDFAEACGAKRNAVEDFLIQMIPFLSKNQKNKPYDNEKGYYYIDYSMLYESREEIVSVYKVLIDKLQGER